MKWTMTAQDGVGTIRLYGPIWQGAAEWYAEQLDMLGDVKTVHQWINSNGGSVDDGFAIYEATRRHPAFFHAHIEAAAYSIASVIPMAADKRTISQNGLMMIHMPMVSSDDSMTSEQLRLLLAATEKREQDIVDAYSGITGLTGDRLKSMMTTQTLMDADEALTLGFVDEVEETISMAAFARPDSFEIPERYREIFNQHFEKEDDMADSTQPATDPAPAVPVKQVPSPATLPELKAAFPEADAVFMVEMLDQSATIDTARAKWADKLKTQLNTANEELTSLKAEVAELKNKKPADPETPPGNPPVGGVAPATSNSGDSFGALKDEVEKRAEAIQKRRRISPMDARAMALSEIKNRAPELIDNVRSA